MLQRLRSHRLCHILQDCHRHINHFLHIMYHHIHILKHFHAPMIYADNFVLELQQLVNIHCYHNDQSLIIAHKLMLFIHKKHASITMQMKQIIKNHPLVSQYVKLVSKTRDKLVKTNFPEPSNTIFNTQ